MNLNALNEIIQTWKMRSKQTWISLDFYLWALYIFCSFI